MPIILLHWDVHQQEMGISTYPFVISVPIWTNKTQEIDQQTCWFSVPLPRPTVSAEMRLSKHAASCEIYIYMYIYRYIDVCACVHNTICIYLYWFHRTTIYSSISLYIYIPIHGYGPVKSLMQCFRTSHRNPRIATAVEWTALAGSS